eukprot:CAMPEP_0194718468 /NCGR_PEP_ID=MMETSP0296-20130528/10029_1 /TAXON_ID=39354 /ORGANISM="Heterosigma akashiwo, Strain CCMP2393" /LENGTH=79 /DNA_ID=CAMNT_0039619775 /DNA_START=92 /DNA_END=331 /DNA_ORIENTATION=-
MSLIVCFVFSTLLFTSAMVSLTFCSIFWGTAATSAAAPTTPSTAARRRRSASEVVSFQARPAASVALVRAAPGHASSAA